MHRADPGSRARRWLADAVDVYVEDIAFSLDDLEAIAAAASDAGLALRVHADQLGDSGAATQRRPGSALAAPTT